MRKILRMIGFGILVILLILVLLATYRFYSFGKESQAMSPVLGLVEGKLKSCPSSPNCVVSYETDDSHYVEAIDGGVDAFEVLKRFLAGQSNVELVSESSNYIHATFTSTLFQFVDDLELYLDGDKVHVRSASRVGYSDMNANRKRIETLRSVLSP